MKTFSRFLLPALGGFVLTLSFAPYKLSLFAWVAFIPLFYSLSDEKYPFLKGFTMGITFFATLLFWVPFSNVGSPILLQVVSGYFLLLLYLSCFFGLGGLLYKKLKKLNRIYLFPLVFSGLEFFRSLSSVFGFPWGSLGYSQGNLIHFVQFASLGGIPLVTLWVVFINILLFILIDRYVINKKSDKIYIYLLIGIIVFPFLYSEVIILRGYRSPGEITVTILQPNVLPEEKRFGYRKMREERIERMFLNAPKSNLYILPETASPYSLTQSEGASNFFSSLADDKNAYIIVGMPDFEVKNRKLYHYNGAALVDSTGVIDGYRKIFLVPFVERFPFDDVIPLFSKIQLGQGHFTPGQIYTVFDVGWGKFSVSICYEAIFSQLIRIFVLRDVDFLVNITEDGWFGNTSAPYQHAQMAIFRSIEFRRPLLRSANTGVSLISDPFGRIIKRTTIYNEARITGEIPLVKGLTVYARIGDLFGWLFLLFVVGLVIYRNKLNA